MSDDETDVPGILGGRHLLDDLELIRAGVELSDPLVGLDNVPFASSPLARELIVVEPEGVPVAGLRLRSASGPSDRYRLTRPVQFIGRRPERPFESLHRGVDTVTPADITVVLDHAIAPADLVDHLPAGATVLLLVVASVERDGECEPHDLDVCRHARDLSLDLSGPRYGLGRVDVVVVPIARDHPHRTDRIKGCSTAYSQGGVIANVTRTVEQPPTLGPGGVLFFTGLSGSGKSTIARAVRNRLLEDTDRRVTLLDGDTVRRHLSSGLGFGQGDRDLNIKRIGWVAARVAEHGGLAICSPIAPFDATRQVVREMTNRAGAAFLLVHVSTPLAECERRDRKGLYARARRGEIPDFTGISSPYEEPTDPDLRVDTTDQDVDEVVRRVLEAGQTLNMWPSTGGS